MPDHDLHVALLAQIAERANAIVNYAPPWHTRSWEAATGTVAGTAALVWADWAVVAERTVSVLAEPLGGGGHRTFTTVLLRHPATETWACLDVLADFVPDAGRSHARWETHSPAARVHSVGALALDRGCPLGHGPVGLAQEVGTELDRRVRTAAPTWLAYARMGAVLLRLDPTRLAGQDPDGTLAEEVGALQMLAGLGGLDNLAHRVAAAEDLLLDPIAEASA